MFVCIRVPYRAPRYVQTNEGGGEPQTLYGYMYTDMPFEWVDTFQPHLYF